MPTMRAVVTFHTPGRTVNEGDEFESSDPVVKDRPLLFEVVRGAGVEEATARPGEKRSAVRATPKKKV